MKNGIKLIAGIVIGILTGVAIAPNMTKENSISILQSQITTAIVMIVIIFVALTILTYLPTALGSLIGFPIGTLLKVFWGAAISSLIVTRLVLIPIAVIALIFGLIRWRRSD